MSENEFLLIKIENTKPIELADFTNAFVAINAQYKRYVNQNYKQTDEEIKLYVEELKEGSKIVKILRYASHKLFLEPIIEKFNKHLQEQFNAFLEQKLPSLEERLGKKFTKQELHEVNSIFGHNGKDYNSNIHLQSGKGDNITHHHYYTGIQSRAIIDESDRNIKLIDNGKNTDFQDKVLELSITDKNAVKGKIDDIYDKPVKILCNPDLQKEMITDNEKNPFNMYYIVSGEIKRAGDKIIAYSIKNVVDKGIINEENES